VRQRETKQYPIRVQYKWAPLAARILIPSIAISPPRARPFPAPQLTTHNSQLTAHSPQPTTIERESSRSILTLPPSSSSFSAKSWPPLDGLGALIVYSIRIARPARRASWPSDRQRVHCGQRGFHMDSQADGGADSLAASWLLRRTFSLHHLGVAIETVPMQRE